MKTDTLVDTEKLKEQIKQELVVEMQMQISLLKRLCCHQVVLSPVSNRASPSPSTLTSSYAPVDNIGLIDGTAELTMEVRYDDHTQQDLIGMLTEPTYCGLWITWNGLQCEAASGLIHPEQTTYIPDFLFVYDIFANELVEYPPNDEMMTLRQAKGQRLQWTRCWIHIMGPPAYKSPSQATIQIPCSSQSTG
jgi:hypothetical protein